jgi:hypothetical protein
MVVDVFISTKLSWGFMKVDILLLCTFLLLVIDKLKGYTENEQQHLVKRGTLGIRINI